MHYNFQPVLDNINLSIASKEVCVIEGSNGAGKTTLLKIASTFQRPSKGTVWLFEEEVDLSFSNRSKIGILFSKNLFTQTSPC